VFFFSLVKGFGRTEMVLMTESMENTVIKDVSRRFRWEIKGISRNASDIDYLLRIATSLEPNQTVTLHDGVMNSEKLYSKAFKANKTKAYWWLLPRANRTPFHPMTLPIGRATSYKEMCGLFMDHNPVNGSAEQYWVYKDALQRLSATMGPDDSVTLLGGRTMTAGAILDEHRRLEAERACRERMAATGNKR
jgi:hypothetical protein